MKFRLNSSMIVALVLCVGIGLWMVAGEVVVGGQSESGSDTPSIAERTDQDTTKAFKVSYIEIAATERTQSVAIRGRTKADAIIPIRSETGGILEKRLVSRGDRVNAGDLVCVLDRGARETSVESARAGLEMAQADYTAAVGLNKKGFSSDTRVRQTKAALDSAKAQLKQAEIELSRVEVKANASGIVQDPVASVGDVLSAGAACITLLDADPMFFTGQIAERAVPFARTGMKAKIRLVNGQTFDGKVTYIAPSADAKTRTFATEIEIDTTNTPLRDGLSATAEILLPPTKAYKISPSWITLDNEGKVGIKSVSAENTVTFVPITVLAQTNDGFWVSGLTDGTKIITLGQEYVNPGELVEPVPDQANSAKANS